MSTTPPTITITFRPIRGGLQAPLTTDGTHPIALGCGDGCDGRLEVAIWEQVKAHPDGITVADILAAVREKAIKASDASIRETVRHMQMAHLYPLATSPARGIYMAASVADIRDNRKQLLSRIKELQERADALGELEATYTGDPAPLIARLGPDGRPLIASAGDAKRERKQRRASEIRAARVKAAPATTDVLEDAINADIAKADPDDVLGREWDAIMANAWGAKAA